ncbi:DMT family transporter [Rubrivirga sp.]|uniref:DMT family transporter n=1 Tax=Rubrivirga sp. TaxID=1885344 RepID=UPI003C777029
MSKTASELALLAVILVWGVNFAVIKVPLEVAPPFTVNVLRFAVSLTVLAVLYRREARHRGQGLASTFEIGWTRVVGVGLLGVLVYQLMFILGIDRVSSGTAALMMATSPAWTSVASHVLKQERLLVAGWIGLAVSLGGVGLVVAGNPGAAFQGGRSGVLLMLAAALAWGLYTTLSRPLLDRGASALGLSFWGVLLSFPGLVLLALPEQSQMDWSRIGALEVGALLFSGGLSTGLAYAIWNQSVSVVGASRTAAFSNLVPVVGVAAGVALRGETVTLVQALGGALVIAGVVLVRRRGVGPLIPTTGSPRPRGR